jgi:hypothetical protein
MWHWDSDENSQPGADWLFCRSNRLTGSQGLHNALVFLTRVAVRFEGILDLGRGSRLIRGTNAQVSKWMLY